MCFYAVEFRLVTMSMSQTKSSQPRLDLPEGILLPLLGCATIKDIRLSNEFSDARRPISFGRVELLRNILIAL
nr:hypothetical protein SHINE37_100273 [Rhizobiaceae bacterium]